MSPITDEAVEAAAVTRREALVFLECACRNWSHIPRLSEDDIDDVAAELTRFASKRVLSSPAPEAAGVTDEMVERARLAFHAYVNSGPVQPDYSDAWRAALTAALEAARRVREEGKVE